MRTCDGCTLCCTLLAVPSLEKAANTPCKHCVLGCELFGDEKRPPECAPYECAWLFNESWPESLRPDRCGVVFEPFGDLNFMANVDTDRPRAWEEGAAQEAITKMMRNGIPVIVVVGTEKHVLLPQGFTPEMVWDAFDESVRKA